MGDWSRLVESCKNATGKKIDDTFDASEVVDELSEKINKHVNNWDLWVAESQVKNGEYYEIAFYDGINNKFINQGVVKFDDGFMKNDRFIRPTPTHIRHIVRSEPKKVSHVEIFGGGIESRVFKTYKEAYNYMIAEYPYANFNYHHTSNNCNTHGYSVFRDGNTPKSISIVMRYE